MRALGLSLFLLAIHFVPAQAQTYDPRYAKCMKVYEGSFGGGEWIDCSYTSLPQCQASAFGRAATCVINPYFAQAFPRGRYPRYPRAY
ncbi:DUF3551 domain-containing protein [Bradyrhizobium diversitatis]|uniref:DUF3551 domain-containing protein n=1 Tax=Bradyrhizobium diversitatis TaxID=2755406 RepID=A0ABS0PAG8_9BRAD|nr:DUF3551 domain-containing protein [Bradyrhizobium diversitatis]MBH5390289.1 DUF3551 domain-containing protein [Bradyrhizobium diversitatis]